MGAAKQAWGWYPAGKVWVPLQVDVDGKVVVDMSAIHTLLDADADTGWDVEQAADEDKIHGKVKGVEAFLLDDIGVLTLAKQSGAKAARTGAVLQKIPDATWTHIAYNGEDYDTQGELDTSIKTGDATATTPDHLIDTVNNQFAASDVGKTVYNHTDGTYATVTAYNSVSDLTLDTDIMANGETYELYFARFTAKTAGIYIALARVYISIMTDTHQLIMQIKKNGAEAAKQKLLMAGPGDGYITCPAIVDLAVDDYLDGWVYQNEGATRDLTQNGGMVWMAVQKVA